MPFLAATCFHPACKNPPERNHASKLDVSGDMAVTLVGSYRWTCRFRDAAKNLCPNGDFERLQDAVARRCRRIGTRFGQARRGRVEMSDDAFQGKRSLRTATTASDRVGANTAIIPMGCGRIRFHYKVLNSSVERRESRVYAIGLAGLGGGEVTRQGLVPPKKHVGDGKWHQGDLNFDFSPKGVGHALIGIRINEGGAIGNGDWLIDAVEVYFGRRARN